MKLRAFAEDITAHRGDRRRRCARNISDGPSKRAYSSKGAAERAAKSLAETHCQPVMRAYHCYYCQRWHLTSDMKERA